MSLTKNQIVSVRLDESEVEDGYEIMSSLGVTNWSDLVRVLIKNEKDQFGSRRENYLTISGEEKEQVNNRKSLPEEQRKEFTIRLFDALREKDAELFQKNIVIANLSRKLAEIQASLIRW